MPKFPESCIEDIVCPDCKEHTTRHEPCCPGTPTCECMECGDCRKLFPEEELTALNICEDCLQGRKDNLEYAKTLDYVGAWWSSDQ